ncbi:MAG: class I SAM-dependent methyltransferase [Gammaproteobacteria bacterium]|nr:MAG: class I SAM-dependent methyltransferase [Gammaproteobacteria bacterium]
MSTACKIETAISRQEWVRETRFGRWFLSTNIWFRHVLGEAVLDFSRLLGADHPAMNRLLDAGCGIGAAFSLLEHYFQPDVIVGVDIDRELIEIAATSALQCQSQVILESSSVVDLDFPDQSFDMIFCHQFLHHTADQKGALQRFYRLLTPGGVVLVGESCRPFIRSLPVRLLFKHPVEAQKSAVEFIDLVKSMGFEVGEHDVKISTPWWSRWDLGLSEKLGIAGKKTLQATEVLIVARKPALAQRSQKA